MTVQTVTLTDQQWNAEREAVTQRFLGMGAEEFRQRYLAGEFDEVEPDGLMAVLAFFPDLD